jgi:fatty acid desaturase
MLRYAADMRTLATVCAWFCVELVAWSRPADVSMATVGLVIACGLGSFLGAVAAHNAVHCPVFVSRRLEQTWRCVLTCTYGHPVSAFVPTHNLSHHRHLESSRDVMRTPKANARWNLLNLLLFAPRLTGALWGAEVGYVRFAWRRRARWRRQLVLESSTLLVLGLVLAAADWRKFGLFVVVPHAYAAWGIVTMNLFQHDGADPSSPHNHSRSFVGQTINWITFNNGYHAAHHLRPTLHWSLLPLAHERLVAPHTDARLIVPSFLAYAFRTYVLPGRRLRFDGRSLPPKDAGKDRPWYGPSSLPADNS